MATDGIPEADGNLSSSPLFDAYAERWGGVARRRPMASTGDGFENELLIAIQSWREITRRPRRAPGGAPFAGHFGFLEDPTPNAFADCVEGVHFAGVHRGLLDMFDFLGTEIYIRRRLLDVAGQEIRVDPDEPLDLRPSPDTIAAQRAAYREHIGGVNIENVLAARYFRHFGVILALFHEFHHCIFGHCAYAEATLGLARLNEYGQAGSAAGTWELHKEVEFIADMAAIELMFWYVDRGGVFSRLYPRVLPLSAQHRVMLAVLSVLCALWNRMEGQGASPRRHPDPAQRFLALTGMYAGHLRRRYRWAFWKPLGILRRFGIDTAILSVHSPELTEVRVRLLEIDHEAWLKGEMAPLFELTHNEISAYEYGETSAGGRSAVRFKSDFMRRVAGRRGTPSPPR